MEITKNTGLRMREVWTVYVGVLGVGDEAKVQVRVTRYERQTRPNVNRKTWTTVAWWSSCESGGCWVPAVREHEDPPEKLAEPPRLSDDEILTRLRSRTDVVWT